MSSSSRHVITFGDHSFNVELLADGQIGTPAGARSRATRVRPGKYLVTTGERQTVVYLSGPPEAPLAFCEGVVYELEVRDAAARSHGRVLHDLLEAPMPATVVEILVAPGRRVEVGDTLVTLEAMKMQMPIRAPHSGIVIAVRCQVGELVQPGVALIEMENE